jgi:hypothetical protein
MLIIFFLLLQLPLAKLQEDVLTKLQKVVIFAFCLSHFLNSFGLNGALFYYLVAVVGINSVTKFYFK